MRDPIIQHMKLFCLARHASVDANSNDCKAVVYKLDDHHFGSLFDGKNMHYSFCVLIY